MNDTGCPEANAGTSDQSADAAATSNQDLDRCPAIESLSSKQANPCGST
jgi:hypothetical protein